MLRSVGVGAKCGACAYVAEAANTVVRNDQSEVTGEESAGFRTARMEFRTNPGSVQNFIYNLYLITSSRVVYDMKTHETIMTRKLGGSHASAGRLFNRFAPIGYF